MILSRIKLIIFLIIAVGLLFAAVHYGAGSQLSPLTTQTSTAVVQDPRLIGVQAPYFDLPDILGNHSSSSDYNGKPLIVVFWSTWNADATNQIKILDDFIRSHSTTEQMVTVVAIDSLEDPSVVSSYMHRGGYAVPVLVDAQGNVSDAYHIKSLPTFYFIGSDGVIKEQYVGVLSQNMIVDKAEQLL